LNRLSGTRVRAAALLLASALIAIDARPAVFAASSITVAECEGIGAGTYRITYETAQGGPIRVYTSASPDRFDLTSPPLVTATASPVTVSVPQAAGRVYFHLRPESGPARVVATRRLPLDGAVNFRDLGGYRTTDDRFVRWGLLYRTDHLVGLTSRDYEYLAALGIRLVCDLRTPGERQRSPTKWQGAEPAFLLAPILSDADLPATPTPLAKDEFMRRFETVSKGEPLRLSTNYSRYAIQYVASYRELFRRLVAGELPAATHCTAGQDRTGVYSAILLTALGVPRETVVTDYLLTSRYRLTDAVVEQRRREWKDLYNVDATPAVVRAMQGLRAETLSATFDVIDRTYGSFDAFRRDALDVSDAELEALRDRLLEP
jgi:protein-tyrosine phosphatase